MQRGHTCSGYFCGLRMCVFTTMSCANTAKLIEMPFGVWTSMGRKNHIQGGSLDLPGEGTIWGHLLARAKNTEYPA